ncbi:MAG TPA: succinate dehydrogenase, hydrophobic membrane anchor protein [Alphaproteobacteria bacterium]|nr:succinate dehydrogenase, hydrophobic membrane anchor protein [Alphaproteobacteria bacterium]
MKHDEKSLRTLRGRVEGLGAAKEGVHHWWMQRMTALALIPLSMFIMGSFFNAVVFGSGYASATAWLQSPYMAVAMIAFLIAGFHHAASGVQVVIEDYVHCPVVKTASIVIVKFAAALLALLGIVAVLHIMFAASPLPPANLNSFIHHVFQ